MNSQGLHPHPTCPARPPRRLPWFIALCAAVLLSAACTTRQPHRLGARTCEVPLAAQDARGKYHWEASDADGRPCGDARQVSIAKPVRFSVNFVEFDDQGVFASRAQAEAALAHAARSEPGGSYVVVFIHGWHHDAGIGDGNVQAFYDALSSVSRWNPGRHVKGIFIGWRGESIDVRGLNNITFWDRKGTSDEVGRGALLEFLLRLEQGVKLHPRDNNRLALVGHSFGASVAFNALAHVHMERMVAGLYASGDGPRFRGWGDLVVLVNPAIEAMRYMPFQSALEHYARDDASPRLDFSRETRPALVVLSSTTDFPTRRLFPVGRLATTAFEAHTRVSSASSPDPDGRYSEWKMDLQTMGNYERFQTHATIDLASPDRTDAQKGAQPNLSAGLSRACTPVQTEQLMPLLYQTGDATAIQHFPDSLVRVSRLDGSGLDRSPYLVAAVDEQIVDGHNGIGSANLVCWINQLLDTREPEPAPPVPDQRLPLIDYKARS